MRADRMYRIRNPDTLRGLMEARGMTIRGLAAEAQCSHSTIGHLRTGHTREVSHDIAEGIAEALDVKVGDMFEDARRVAWCKR